MRSRANLSAWMLSAPAILFIAVLFVYPLLDVIVISFTDPTLSLANYREFLLVVALLQGARKTPSGSLLW